MLRNLHKSLIAKFMYIVDLQAGQTEFTPSKRHIDIYLITVSRRITHERRRYITALISEEYL